MALRFQCRHCVYCCYFSSYEEAPIVFPWEKRLLEELAEKHGFKLRFEPILVLRRNDVCVVALYRWLIRGFCPFYDFSTRLCRIHYLKPLACRMYPLILDASHGRIIVSTKCAWVEHHLDQMKRIGERLLEVMPSEVKAAVEAFTYMKSMEEVARGLKLVRGDGLGDCVEVYDFDEYIAKA